MDKKREEGSVLVISLLVSIVILILLGVFSGSIIAERKRQERSYRSLRALNLAEAGVEKAIWELNNNSTPSGQISIDGVGEGEYTITSSGNTVVVQATGYVPEINIAVERRVEKGLEVHLTYYKGSFEYAIVGQGLLKLEKKEGEETFVTGDLYCMGSISNEGVTVDGWGYATGMITGSGTFTEGTEEGVEPISFPVVDFADYESQATVSGNISYGNKTVGIADSPFYVPDILYVKGYFWATSAELVGPGIIVAEGTIKLANSTCGSSGAPVGLISASSNSTTAIKIETNSNVHGVLYAPFGGIKVESGSTVYGCIIGGEGVDTEVKIETGGGVIYQNYYDLLNLPSVPGSELYTFERWRGK